MKDNINYSITSVQDQPFWTLKVVKNYLRVVHENDDQLITDLIETAILSAEQFLGIALLIRTISCTLHSAPDVFTVKYAPLVKITSVALILEDEEEDIMEDYGYANLNYNQIHIDSAYLGKRLKINYEAGLGDKVPRNILHGILSHIGMMYDAGENAAVLFREVKDMYLPYRSLKI